MYSVIGIKRILAAYGWIATFFLGIILLIERVRLLSALTTSNIFPVLGVFWGAVGKALMLAAGLLWLLGETPLFAVVCRNRWIRRFVPDLDGKWVGTVNSNWLLISHRSSVAQSPPDPGVEQRIAPTNVTVTIQARLLSVTMTLEADTNYSDSETLLVGVTKRPGSGVVEVRYIYQNRTRNPQRSDSASHLGAAILDLEQKGNEMFLTGPYWTNRNWQNGLNTAGTVTFRRAAEF
ncbi:hypothetical protein JK208_15445 [Gluconobacter sp. Dm-74]|uniref:Cap15 family cyclic dinucleotide receptor domain-containing protein n=1 Tax=Gluconobacter sp. Dm-74 TaxID=2799803 RepID=UPI001B8BE659|nr:hypothetical protein [Gluconobacter sp. Dm-74]MBS1092964.1 hypothetical protein [Gluconobacter sp. Dm-74]